MNGNVNVIPIEQGENAGGYQLQGLASVGIPDGTIVPPGYDPDQDQNLTEDQRTILNRLLYEDEGDDYGSGHQYVQPQQQYVQSPQVPQPQFQQFPQGPSVGYAPPQVGVAGVTGGDTSGYMNQKTRNFMERKWSWLENPPDIASQAYSIYMRKQQHNARRMSQPRNTRRKNKVRIPAMFRF